MSYRLVYTKQSHKDAKKLKKSGLKEKSLEILSILESTPFQNPPPFETLVGDLERAYSRRINIHHRMVFQVLDKRKTVKAIRMWTHYE